MRTEIIFRADNITGPYEGRVIFKDRGIAQGTLVEKKTETGSLPLETAELSDAFRTLSPSNGRTTGQS